MFLGFQKLKKLNTQKVFTHFILKVKYFSEWICVESCGLISAGQWEEDKGRKRWVGIGKEKWQKCFLGCLHYGSRLHDPGKALGFFKAGGKFEL